MPPPAPAALSITWRRKLCGEIPTAIPAWHTLSPPRKAVAIGNRRHLLLLSEPQLGEPGFLLPSHDAEIQAAFASKRTPSAQSIQATTRSCNSRIPQRQFDCSGGTQVT